MDEDVAVIPHQSAQHLHLIVFVTQNQIFCCWNFPFIVPHINFILNGQYAYLYLCHLLYLGRYTYTLASGQNRVYFDENPASHASLPLLCSFITVIIFLQKIIWLPYNDKLKPRASSLNFLSNNGYCMVGLVAATIIIASIIGFAEPKNFHSLPLTALHTSISFGGLFSFTIITVSIVFTCERLGRVSDVVLPLQMHTDTARPSTRVRAAGTLKYPQISVRPQPMLGHTRQKTNTFALRTPEKSLRRVVGCDLGAGPRQRLVTYHLQPLQKLIGS